MEETNRREWAHEWKKKWNNWRIDRQVWEVRKNECEQLKIEQESTNQKERQQTTATNKRRRQRRNRTRTQSDTEWVYNVKIIQKKSNTRRNTARRKVQWQQAGWHSMSRRQSTWYRLRRKRRQNTKRPNVETRSNGMLLIEIQVENSIGICRNGIKKMC